VTTLTAEGTGVSVDEAKQRALRELERLAPRLDRAAVRFEVVEEGRRGLLGLGSSPARVRASVAAPAAVGGGGESERAARVRALLERVVAATGAGCRVEVAESAEAIAATCTGGEAGLLIGRRGQTVDALQTLAAAVAARGPGERKEVTVDVAGYRARRRRALEALALRAADEALRTGGRVELEPMSAADRRVVHERLKTVRGVRTASEGDEPDRFVVVEPA